MKRLLLLLLLIYLFDTASTGQCKYAGTKKSLIGKAYTNSRNLTNLKVWTWMHGGLSNSLKEPERIVSDIFMKGTTYLVLFGIMEDTASGKFKVMDVVEISGVLKGCTVRSSFCRQNGKENNYIIACGKDGTAEYMKLIKKFGNLLPTGDG